MSTSSGDGSSGGQYGLFGDPVPIRPKQRRPAESNDVELMVTVAANAARCGYLLVGTAERVYTRTDADDRAARVPRYEEGAVHQLLWRRWLTLGAAHPITCGAAPCRDRGPGPEGHPGTDRALEPAPTPTLVAFRSPQYRRPAQAAEQAGRPS